MVETNTRVLFWLIFQPERARPTPQYVPVDRQARQQGEPRVQGSIYAPVATHAPTPGGPPTVHSALHTTQTQFEQQPGFNGQTSQTVQAQILPSGHMVYVNAPPPQHQYATVQYHPHTQQHHIVHQTVPGGAHPNEQFISVVPIQAGGTQVQGVAPGGTYAYWQPDGQPVNNGIGQTLTIVNAHGPGGVPIAVARVGNAGIESQPQQTGASHGGGGRGKEKTGKGRRGGATNARRGAAESKHQPHAASSPLLEEFRVKKNRDWTIVEIKGEFTVIARLNVALEI